MAASPTVMDHGDGSYTLEEEIELLGAIYIHELTLQGPRERPTAVSVLLHPSTGEEQDKRFVCLTLVICLPEKYPAELPSVHIKTPRGLSEAHVESILENLRELAEGCLGRPMLYELIEYAKESLTDNNTPSCACAICLGHFQDDHEFTKTECYHYFHCGCLARYIEFSLQQEKEPEDDTKIECPMCRLPITYDLAELKTVASSAVNEEEFIYKPSAEIRKLQKKMSSLLEKQKRKGGVIDVEQEKNKFLIDITSVRQEETGPKSEPPTGDETDTVKKNPIAEHLANDVSKRVDAEKEPSQADSPVMRKDKPERKEKKDFAKYSGISRGPRRPIDKTRHRSGREKFQNNEQRTTEKKRPTTCDRPKSVEQEEKEKESAKESDKHGSDFALWAETNSDDNRTDVESGKKSRVGETPEKDLGKDPGKGPGKDPGKGPEKDPEKGPGKDPGPGSGKDQEKDQGNGPIKDPGKGPGKDQEKDPGNGPGRYPGKGSGNDPVKDPGKGPRRDLGKYERGVTGRGYNNKSSENSFGERPRSARRGRGRSGRGKPFAGSASESGRGVRNMNKRRTSSGEAVKLSEVTGALEKSKPPLEKDGRLKAQNNSHQENPSREDGRSIKKDKFVKPPPGFENFQADKVGREQSTTDYRPPPGFKQHSAQPRPPPGLGNLAERPGQNTSPSITS